MSSDKSFASGCSPGGWGAVSTGSEAGYMRHSMNVLLWVTEALIEIASIRRHYEDTLEVAALSMWSTSLYTVVEPA